MTRVKICGITNLEDAILAADLGVDALGFVFASSPRKVSLSRAKEIIEKIPPFISCVGVFVNEGIEKVKEIARECNLGCIQLHGEEPPELCQELYPYRVIKTIRVKNKKDLKLIPRYIDVKAILLDTFVEGKAGGTGVSFDWQLAREAQKYGKPIILSGGLSAENVKRAVEMVHPFAVDVSSSLEASPGKKDSRTMKSFMQIFLSI